MLYLLLLDTYSLCQTSTNEINLTEWVTILIACLAIFISIYNVVATRNHNKLSVKPILTFLGSVNSDNQNFTYKIKNIGLGPVIVRDFVITKKNKKLDFKNAKDMYNIFVHVFSNKFRVETHCMSPDDAIGSGESIIILSISLPSGATLVDKNEWELYFKNLSSYQLIIKYKSMYNKNAIFKEDMSPPY